MPTGSVVLAVLVAPAVVVLAVLVVTMAVVAPVVPAGANRVDRRLTRRHPQPLLRLFSPLHTSRNARTSPP